MTTGQFFLLAGWICMSACIGVRGGLITGLLNWALALIWFSYEYFG